MISGNLPPRFDYSELIPIRNQNGRYLFPDRVNARVAKATDHLGKIISMEVNYLNDFVSSAFSESTPLFSQPTLRLAHENNTHFRIIHPAGERADAEQISALLDETSADLNKWLRAIAATPLQPYILVRNGRNQLSVFGALWHSVVNDGTYLYPIVLNRLGHSGRLPRHASYIKRPLAQRAGAIEVIWEQSTPPPVTRQEGYGNLRSGFRNYRGGQNAPNYY